MADDEIFELGDSLKPWHRQMAKDAKGVVRYESGKAWSAFKVYCSLGDERSIRAVAKQVGKTRCLIERWSKRWKWPERVKAFDDHMDEATQAGRIKARKQMAERQARTALLAQNLCVNELVRIQAELAAGTVTTNLAVVGRLLDIATRLERLSRGADTNRDDDVAKISVTFEMQQAPRFVTETTERETTETAMELVELLKPSEQS